MERISQKKLKQFINDVANITKWETGIEKDHVVDIYVSKIDGGYFTHVGMENHFKILLKRGITQQLQKCRPDGNTVCIGYNPKEKKWYGWSHRAIYGFTIGSNCKKGQCHYTPEKGEWQAKTMEDAKQMAIDFAMGVS